MSIKIEKFEQGMFFPTPIWSIKLAEVEEVNRQLLQVIAGLQKNDQVGLRCHHRWRRIQQNGFVR